MARNNFLALTQLVVSGAFNVTALFIVGLTIGPGRRIWAKARTNSTKFPPKKMF